MRDNPDYETQIEEFARRKATFYRDDPGEPPRKLTLERVLTMELTDEEYHSVKKGVLEVM